MLRELEGLTNTERCQTNPLTPQTTGLNWSHKDQKLSEFQISYPFTSRERQLPMNKEENPMRKIEQQMVNAVQNRAVRFVNGNTWVSGDGDKSQVFLHNNHVATVHHDTGKLDVNRYTLRKWPTNTTISRLRALGAKVETRKGVVYVDGEAI